MFHFAYGILKIIQGYINFTRRAPNHVQTSIIPQNYQKSKLSLSLSLLVNPAHISSKFLRPRLRPSRGFTIVELLIVIVVIGILAAISIVAYNGISQKANNAAIINAASNSLKVVQAYIAQEGKYPYSNSGSGWLCITSDIACSWTDGGVINSSSTFNSNIAAVGSVPRTVPVSGAAANGVIVFWSVSYTLDGVSRPFSIQYWLQGTNQQCGLRDVVWIDSGGVLRPSTTGYTGGMDVGGTKTRCVITVPGPAV